MINSVNIEKLFRFFLLYFYQKSNKQICINNSQIVLRTPFIIYKWLNKFSYIRLLPETEIVLTLI